MSDTSDGPDLLRPAEKDKIPTPYTEPYKSQIKTNIMEVWKRVRSTRGLTQASLSQALNLSQGAVSKLLSDDNGHPWTVDRIKKFIEFCRVPPTDVLGENTHVLAGFFNEWSGDTIAPDGRLIDECFHALDRYFTSTGRNLSRERLLRLATMLAVRVEPTERKKEDFDAQIYNVILDEVSRSSFGSGRDHVAEASPVRLVAGRVSS